MTAVPSDVRAIVSLLLKRPITEAIALEVEQYPGFEHLEVVAGAWVGLDEEEPVGGEEHGWLESKLGFFLTAWALQTGLARVYPGDTDFVLEGDSENIVLKRRPDIAVVLRERVRPSKGYLYGAPDVAVEIISPTERPAAVRRKRLEYLQCGVRQVWHVFPDTRELVVHDASGTSYTYGVGDTLTDAAVLPGFTLRLAELFETV